MVQWLEIGIAAFSTATLYSMALGFLARRLIRQYDEKFKELERSMAAHEERTGGKIDRLDTHIQTSAEAQSEKVARVHQRIDGLVETFPRDYVRRPEQGQVLQSLERIEKKVDALQARSAST